MTYATIYKRHERPGGGMPLWEIVTVDTSHAPMRGTRADMCILDDVVEYAAADSLTVLTVPEKYSYTVLAHWFKQRMKELDHES